MKDFIFWFVTWLLHIAMVLVIFLHKEFSEFEKCVLILIVGILISLNNIKDIIKHNFKTSK